MTKTERYADAHRRRGDDPWHLVERLYARIDELENGVPKGCVWIVESDEPGNPPYRCGDAFYVEELPHPFPAGVKRALFPSIDGTFMMDKPIIPLCARHIGHLAERLTAIVDIKYDGVHAQKQAIAIRNTAVYYIRRHSDGLIKIGFSIDVPNRMMALRGEHGPLELLATENGGRPKEAQRHRQWADVRVAGGWFRPIPEIMAQIDELNGVVTGE